MRLIDADALIEKFNEKVDMAECLIDARTAERFATFCALADAVEEMPTVDAVPVVRCKNCKYAYYYNEEGCRGFVCNGYFQYADVESNDFCSYGEMRNNYE